MERQVKVFLACVLGTMTGLAVALSVPEIIWWVGAIIGGATSGLFYALPEIKHYAPKAAKIAWEGLQYAPNLIRALVVYRWRILLLLVALISSGLLVWSLVVFPEMKLAPGEAGEESGVAVLFALVAIFLVLYFVVCLALSVAFIANYRDEILPAEDRDYAKTFAPFFSPIGPLLIIAWLVVKGTPHIVRGSIRLTKKACGLIKEACSFTVEFSKTLFTFIHSKELVLCTVDGALAVLLSYIVCVTLLTLPLGPTLLLGGLIGGLIGILDYEIISKRVLHIVSSK